MNAASIGCLIPWQNTKHGHHPEGFSLLEMMMLIALVLIVASVATPI
jgi:prepilin-type N-terminal cleavage/methylation domain-containing protein